MRPLLSALVLIALALLLCSPVEAIRSAVGARKPAGLLARLAGLLHRDGKAAKPQPVAPQQTPSLGRTDSTGPAVSAGLINAVNAAGALWTAGRSRRMEPLSVKEYSGLLGVLGPRPPGTAPLPLQPLASLRAEHGADPLPDSFDAREAWPECASIQQIRDQGHCGSCWAFGAVEAMSDRACILANDAVTLSANSMLACCGGACGNGCNGGYPEAAWSYWTTDGLATATCDPYFDTEPCHHPGCGPIKPTPSCRLGCADNENWKTGKHFGASAYRVEASEEAIMRELMAHGPVEAAYQVYADFATYTSGIYHHVTGAFMGGHAVKIIGWGSEAINGTDTKYWLVVNSWGRSWGEAGLFRILRGVDECGFESAITAGLPKPRDSPFPPWTPVGPSDVPTGKRGRASAAKAKAEAVEGASAEQDTATAPVAGAAAAVVVDEGGSEVMVAVLELDRQTAAEGGAAGVQADGGDRNADLGDAAASEE